MYVETSTPRFFKFFKLEGGPHSSNMHSTPTQAFCQSVHPACALHHDHLTPFIHLKAQPSARLPVRPLLPVVIPLRPTRRLDTVVIAASIIRIRRRDFVRLSLPTGTAWEICFPDLVLRVRDLVPDADLVARVAAAGVLVAGGPLLRYVEADSGPAAAGYA